jgi:hypothetical protein
MLIGGLNIYVDPDYSLKTDYIPELVDALLEGKIVSGPENVNLRLLKKRWIERLPFSPEVLVLGSSRTLGVGQKSFQGQSFFNASVTNCTFQDMLAFLKLFTEKPTKQLPQTIVICADQWLFGNSFTEKQWLVNRKEAIEMAKIVGFSDWKKFQSKWELDKEWITELFSVRYMVRSISSFGKVEQFKICESINNKRMMFLPDGSRLISESITHFPEQEAAVKAKNYFLSSNDERFVALNQFQCQLFEAMISYLAADKSRNVVIYIPSYHPEIYDMIRKSEETSGTLKTETFILGLANYHHIKVIGATNPGDMQLKASDFYDAVHLKPEVLNKIINEYSIK